MAEADWILKQTTTWRGTTMELRCNADLQACAPSLLRLVQQRSLLGPLV